MRRLNLRQKLAAIIATVVVAFVVNSVVGWFFDREMQNQMSNIRDQYIPLVELGYRLDTQFEAIGLGFRDAVSAQDIPGLTKVQEAKAKLIAELESAKKIVVPEQIDQAKSAVESYFVIANETSQRLIKSESGISIMDAMTEMQTKRALAESLLKKIADFDRGKLSEAFTQASRAQKWAAQVRFWCSVICLAFILLISSFISRDIVSKVNEITAGLARFGEGDFKLPIKIWGRDELSELGRQVNVMAERVQGLMKELEAFSYSVAHDLRAPLRSVLGFSSILLEDHAEGLSPDAKSSLDRIALAAQRMGQMVDGLLSLSRMNRAPLTKQPVNLSKIASNVIEELKSNDPNRVAEFTSPQNIMASADPKLLEVVLSNLLGNAWKFTKKCAQTEIQFGTKNDDEKLIYYVRDNGAGFDMKYADQLFGTFQRLHRADEFEGHGIGLATVKSIINRHGGRIWAESEPEKGATFFFTLG